MALMPLTCAVPCLRSSPRTGAAEHDARCARSARCRLAPRGVGCGQELLQLGTAQRLGEQVTLAELALHRPQRLDLRGLFDPFRDGAEVEGAAKADDHPGDRRRLWTLVDRVDERLVDLEDVHRELPDVAQ